MTNGERDIKSIKNMDTGKKVKVGIANALIKCAVSTFIGQMPFLINKFVRHHKVPEEWTV